MNTTTKDSTPATPSAKTHQLGYLVPALISISIAACLFFQSASIVAARGDNLTTFFSFSSGMNTYRDSLRQEWKPRILSNWLAAFFVRDALIDKPQEFIDENKIANNTRLLRLGSQQIQISVQQTLSAIGSWNACWFIMACVVFIAWRAQDSLLYVFGAGAALCMGYMPGLNQLRMYPWDLPIFFFFSLFVCLIAKKKFRHVAYLAPIAMGFKETAIVMPLVFLFANTIPWKRRFAWCAGTIGACILVKLVVDNATGDTILITMTTREADWPPGARRLISNINNLLSLRLNTPLFVNAGTLLVLFLLPTKNPEMLMVKSIAIAFSLGIFIFAEITEFPVWFEMIPVALLGIDLIRLSLVDESRS
jgi:hypothetical protein